jgi:hypothetical protein
VVRGGHSFTQKSHRDVETLPLANPGQGRSSTPRLTFERIFNVHTGACQMDGRFEEATAS